MADPFVGEIRMFGGNFAPHGWALCTGQLMSIAQNTALFSLLGTNFGGDGKSTFGLPNLQGVVPLNQGQGPGLTDRVMGEPGGSAAVTLITTEIPSHVHAYSAENANAAVTTPSNNMVAVNRNLTAFTDAGASGFRTGPMGDQGIGPAGGSQPHNNLQPYLAVSFIIALVGVFPTRP
jgi:microcystin-dependent protein